MEDLRSANQTQEGKQHIMAAALHLTKALVASDYLPEDMKKIFTDLGTHLSSMAVIAEPQGGLEFSELEQRLRLAEEKVGAWMSNQLMAWDSDLNKASRHSKVIEEIQSLMESLRALTSEYEFGKPMELLRRAESLLHTAMTRLEEELVHILHQHKQYFEPEYMSFRSCGSDVTFDESFASAEEESPEEASQRNSTGSELDDHLVDLIHPNVVPHLKSIAQMMFASDYGQEFCQAFIKARKEALDEYWATLGMDTFSIEDVLKMGWKSLNYEMKRWTWIMKIIVLVYLPSEKRLCDQILGDFGSFSPRCFVETSKATMVYLLNFGEAVAMGNLETEKLFRLLDMYEVLAELVLDIDTLPFEVAGCDVQNEFHELLGKLGDCSRATLVEFRRAIAFNTSTTPFAGGSIHPLTKYVMNYIKTLAEYMDTLNVLLEDHVEEEDPNSVFEMHNDIEDGSSSTCSPVAYHLRSITSTLESNLNNRSRLYNDGALQLVFLMNNINYIVQKVKDSKLGPFFGDAWIREHIARVQQQATGFVRISWGSALPLILSDDGQALPRAIFKERCRAFSIAFEEVYRNQTGWLVPDLKLREDLQISISQRVIHAYRNFTGRNSNDERHIKYTADDLQNFLLDLFEGSPRSLQNSRRR